MGYLSTLISACFFEMTGHYPSPTGSEQTWWVIVTICVCEYIYILYSCICIYRHYIYIRYIRIYLFIYVYIYICSYIRKSKWVFPYFRALYLGDREGYMEDPIKRHDFFSLRPPPSVRSLAPAALRSRWRSSDCSWDAAPWKLCHVCKGPLVVVKRSMFTWLDMNIYTELIFKHFVDDWL